MGKIKSIKVTSFDVYSGSVYSGTAYSTSVVANDHIAHSLSGSNKTNTSYLPFICPDDFVGFESIDVKSRRNSNNCTLNLSMGKGGVIDGTVNNIDVRPTALNTYETKSVTPSSSYIAGDEVLFTLSANTGPGGGNLLDLRYVEIKYYSK